MTGVGEGGWGGGWGTMGVRGGSIALEQSKRKRGPKALVLKGDGGGLRSTCVSAVERSCLEGVYTVRGSE